MTKNSKPSVQLIAPDSYRQMLSKPRAARAMQTLRAPETAAKAKKNRPAWPGGRLVQSSFSPQVLSQTVGHFAEPASAGIRCF